MQRFHAVFRGSLHFILVASNWHVDCFTTLHRKSNCQFPQFKNMTEPNMTHTAPNTATLRNRLRSIQSQWSPAERERRAERGLRRSRELFALVIASESDEGDMCAVGATACEDWRRLAG
jgi:hypothetical protein